MAIFSKHKVNLADLIREIPELELTRLSRTTKVDYYSKVLSGKLVFYLLLYGMLRIDRLSQRGLRDAFSSPWFRTLFNIRGKKEISHSSISDRLSVLKVDFFKGAYDCIYKRFSSLYTKKEISGMYLQRVDSTLVKESCNKLHEGLTLSNQHGNQHQFIKYTMNYDGMFGSFAQAHHEQSYCSECNALPENVISHFKKEKGHSSVYLFDRGQSSADAFKGMKSEEGLLFVGRLNETRNPYYSALNGVLFDKQKERLISYIVRNSSHYTVPNTVKIIEGSSFFRRYDLGSIVIPNSVTTIGDFAFQLCENLKSIYLSNSVSYIGSYALSFTGLETIIFPDLVTDISGNVLWNCLNLKSVVLGANTNVVEVGAFWNCSNLQKIISLNILPPKVDDYYGGDAFDGVNKSTCTLYVPKGSLSLYQKAKGWQDFGKIVESEPTDVSNVSLNKTTVFLKDSNLFINSLESETINIYSVNGMLIVSKRKQKGEIMLPIGHIPNQVLIIKGSSGWERKIMTR